jgi:ectoine hydrolase
MPRCRPAYDLQMSAFERSEYLGRLTQARARMAQAGLDLLFVTTPENINYLSGYAGWSFYTVQGLIVSLGQEEPILVVREMDVACAHATAFLSAANAIGYPEKYIGGELHPMSFIAEVIAERCGPVRRIGIEPAGCFFPITAYQRLQASFPQAELLDSHGIVNWLRTYKSPAEIAVMREAAEIASQAMSTAYSSIAPGVRECDAAADIYRTLIRGSDSHGGGVPASFALVSGPRTGAPHIAWTDHRFQTGQSANLELGGSRHQYHAGLSRSFFLGKPRASLVNLSETVVAGLEAALQAVRPGSRCEEVEAAWRRVITRAGFEKKSRIGYSIGLGFQPTWIDYTASLQEGDRTELRPDMTFHMICGMWQGSENVVLSETFRVTPTGHEVLTRAPRKLLVKN